MSRDNATRHTHSPEQIELPARTGMVIDTRRNTIADLRDFDLRWPLARAILFILALSVGLWLVIAQIFGWL